jgi:hypothetical protein
MQTQIQFKAGHPQKFIATRSFSLGQSGINVLAGAELDFDGTHVTYNGSPSVAMPQLRGAVKAGWVVLAAEYNPDDMTASIPKSAGMRVGNAQGGNPMDKSPKTMVTTVDAEEREVGDVQAHAKVTRDRNANHRPGQRVASSNMSVEAQEGIPVRSLKTPTQFHTDLEHVSADEAIRQANQSGKIETRAGMTREEYAAGLPEDERKEYLATVEAKRAGYDTDEDPAATKEREMNRKILASRIAPVQTQHKEGFTINNHVGGGIETADLGGTGGVGEQQTIESEGLRFTTTNGPKRDVQRIEAPVSKASQDMRRKIAKSICPDFPENYGFDDPVRKKIARLQADYDDRPDVIRAVAAADTSEEVRQRLLEEFPGAFA